MGTTYTALTTQDGVRLGHTLLVEGWENILTDAGPDELAAVAAAYESSEWGEQAGWGTSFIKDWFVIEGKIRRSIQPWQQTLDIPTLTFRVHNETFARAVAKTKPTYRSQLANPFAPAADGSGALVVKSAAAFPSVGPVYMGHKRFEVTSKTGSTQFNLAAGGAQKYAPFAASGGNKYALPHEMSAGKNWDASAQPWVSDVPPSWIGRRVALYVHRIVGGVWDTVEEAQLLFAGRIRVVDEDTKTAATVLGCEDILADVRDAQLLKGQWIGYVKPGIRLIAGDMFGAHHTNDTNNATAAALTVVTSGAAGTAQLNEGYYEIEDFVARLNNWISNDATIAASGYSWTVGLPTSGSGRRLVFAVDWGASRANGAIYFFASSRRLLSFLGFDGDQVEPNRTYIYDDQPFLARRFANGSTTALELESARAPYRIKPFQAGSPLHLAVTSDGSTVDLDTSDGTWVGYADYLPAPFDTWPGAGEDWSFLRIGDALYFGKYASATQITEITGSHNLAGFSSQNDSALGLTVDDSGDRLEICQVVILEDSLANLVTKLFASTGTAGQNHATHDVFSVGLGCPGIPWQLLGDDFTNSIKLLEQGNKDEALTLVIDRPTKLVELLLPEFLLRFSWLTWKPNGGTDGNGGYHFVSPPTPSALTADFTLDMDNKVAPHDQADLAFASVRTTLEHAKNLIKINFNRTLGDKYQNHITIRDTASISDFKLMGVEINAPNSYADAAGTGASVEALAANLGARMCPTFSRPIKTVRRTIPHTIYSAMSCGATATLSDDDVRDPTSGLRGISARACIVLSVTYHPGYGHEGQDPYGEVELLLGDEDRTYPLAPAAEVDTSYSGTVDGITFTNGYAATAAGGPAIKLKEHAYSRATGRTDAEGFANGDLVRIYEVDPADPTTIDAWNRTLAASSSVDATDDYIKLTADISAPAWGGATKLYRVAPQLYSAVQASQKQATYLADDGDGLIEDLAQPNLYGEKPMAGAFNRVLGSDLPTLIANEVYAEGRPVHVGLLNDLIRMANNLASYKGAPHSPLTWDTNNPSTTSTKYRISFTMPFPTGGFLYKATRRVIKVATRLSIADAAQTATCRITSSRHAPHGGSETKWSGPKRSITFTRTGSTSSADQAIQDLPIVKGDRPGMTWITVELKSSAGATAELRALPTLYLGPVTPP